LPSLFNDIKQEIDSRRQFGQFILSGSSAPDDDITMHSGAGRISKIFLRPMSLFESGNSSNEVNFVSLFKSKCKISGTQKCNLEFYVDKILRGGWPRYINLKGQKVKSVIRKYVENIVDIDMRKLKSPPDSMRMYELTKALARNVATQAAIKTLSREAETGSIDKKNNEYGDKTTRKYLDQLSQVYVLEELQAWKTHARSSVRLLEKSK
jgi:predicted AAA+ superfamily ATPase